MATLSWFALVFLMAKAMRFQSATEKGILARE